eukprot:1159844-Pelagomonas_calceolata.AAC.8
MESSALRRQKAGVNPFHGHHGASAWVCAAYILQKQWLHFTVFHFLAMRSWVFGPQPLNCEAAGKPLKVQEGGPLLSD